MVDVKQVTIPTRLSDLPVARQIDEVDWSKRDILALAATGSGKSLLMPAYDSLANDRQVLVRQPTRLATNGVYRGIDNFWEGEVQVGISTRDRKDFDDDCDVVVYSDGSLTGLLAQMTKDPTVYFDEIHSMGLPATEVELALCKAKEIDTRLLSATIDPQQFVDYLPGIEVYNLEGRSFPIEKKLWPIRPTIFDTEEEEFELEVMHTIISDTAAVDEHSLVFLPTKAACEKMADVAKEFGVEATYAHGEVYPPDLEDWCEEYDDEPWVVFATVAAATSITINVGRVYIFDEKVTSRVQNGTEHVYRAPVDNNTLLQMAGRAGRIRNGVATLIYPLDRPRSWEDIEPEPIRTPCANTTPYEVILTMASLGLPISTPLLSDVPAREMEYAAKWLSDNRCIEGEPPALTHLGRSVHGMTLPTQMAHLALRFPRDLRAYGLASVVAMDKGAFMLLDVKPGSDRHKREMGQDPSFSLLPQEWLPSQPNMPLLLGRLIQEAFRNRNSVSRWASRSNVNTKVVKFAMKDYKDAAERAGVTIEELLDTNPEEGAISSTYSRHPVTRTLKMRKGGRGWEGWIELDDDQLYKVLMCKTTENLWGLEGASEMRITGAPKVITTRTGWQFVVPEAPIVQEMR